MAYSYVDCWKRIVIRDGSPCKIVLFPSAMVSIQQVLPQPMKSDNASTPASGKNTWWPMAEYIDMHCSASTRTTHEFQ
uniref:Uncharacterized protein n=1 Tax=Oryza nivara TaxID=4536 RepID=A0A0E0I198_ORYNI